MKERNYQSKSWWFALFPLSLKAVVQVLAVTDQLGITPASPDPPQDQAGIEDKFMDGCGTGSVR